MMLAPKDSEVVKHIHREIYPLTDHGYTWVEYMWFEVEGVRTSPVIPTKAYTEKLGTLPAGPIRCDFDYWYREYAPNGFTCTIETDNINDDGFYEVRAVEIKRRGES